MGRSVEVPIRRLTPEDFAPFGVVIESPVGESDAVGPGWRWWAERAALPAIERPYAVGYLSLEPAPLRFDWAERHSRSVEMIIPVNSDCLIYVASPEALREVDGSLDLEEFRVFRLRSGQAVILKEGIWHGAPLAIDGSLAVFVLLAEGTGRMDTRVVRFGDTPVAIVR